MQHDLFTLFLKQNLNMIISPQMITYIYHTIPFDLTLERVAKDSSLWAMKAAA